MRIQYIPWGKEQATIKGKSMTMLTLAHRVSESEAGARREAEKLFTNPLQAQLEKELKSHLND